MSPTRSQRLFLEVRVDGEFVAYWQATEAESLELSIAASAELVELIAKDEHGEFPLTSMLIPFDSIHGRQQPAAAEVELQAIKRILVLRVTPDHAAEAEAEAETRLELICRAIE